MDIECIKYEAKEKLKKIIEEVYKTNIEEKEQFLNKSLLGVEWELAPRQLLDIFFYVEKEFNITIPEEEVVKGNFNSFNNILNIICNQLNISK